jgi:hypothetical protein
MLVTVWSDPLCNATQAPCEALVRLEKQAKKG